MCEYMWSAEDNLRVIPQDPSFMFETGSHWPGTLNRLDQLEWPFRDLPQFSIALMLGSQVCLPQHLVPSSFLG